MPGETSGYTGPADQKHIGSALDLSYGNYDGYTLIDQPEWTGAKTIAVTLSQSFEIDTAPIILHARHKGQQIVVPRTLPHRQMEFVELNEDTDFDETSFGILEPHDGKVYSPDEIDLMVVPGVAFTASGNRLGFGGGYYDQSY